MPKSAFLLASCLQNGITCSLVRRLINPRGKLVFHNAECLEQSVREWAISSFRDSLGWPAVKAGIAGEILLQSCLVRTALLDSPCTTSLQPGHENPCQVGWVEIVRRKMFPKVWTSFPFCLLPPSVPKRSFQVFVWGFGSFSIAVRKSKAQGGECKVGY